MHFELSPLIVWITLWIVKKYSESQVNILSNNRHYKMSQFSHNKDTDETKAIAIPPFFFSENTRAKNKFTLHTLHVNLHIYEPFPVKRGFNASAKVLTQVSLHRLRRLTWIEAFCYKSILYIPKDYKISHFICL